LFLADVTSQDQINTPARSKRDSPSKLNINAHAALKTAAKAKKNRHRYRTMPVNLVIFKKL